MRTRIALALAASACLAAALIAIPALTASAPGPVAVEHGGGGTGVENPAPEPKDGAYRWGTVGHYALQGAELYSAGLASEGLVNPNLMLRERKQELSDADLAGKGLDLDPRRLAAGMVMLHKEAQGNGELRQRLPKEVKDSLWSVDPQEAAMGLAALRKAIQKDDELNFMVPIEMRLALKASIYVFPSPYVRDDDLRWLESSSVDYGYDRESSIRSVYHTIELFSESPELADLCRGAKEKFVSTYPWITGSAEWLRLEPLCRYYHSESVARFLAKQVRFQVSAHCKELIDNGWIVEDGVFYRPGLDPEEMASALEDGGGAPGADGRMVETDGVLLPRFTKECLSHFTGHVPFHSQ